MAGEIKDVTTTDQQDLQATGPVTYPAFSSIFNNFISGAKNCYYQLLGQTEGCFLKDIKYDDECGARKIERGIKSWGKCAEKCKSTSCLAWTWSSNSCSNCNPEECKLFTGFTSCPNQSPKESIGLGHISGDVSCEDIEYIETEDLTKVTEVVGADRGEWIEGSCRVGEAGADPTCPGQEVPGFRSKHHPLYPTRKVAP